MQQPVKKPPDNFSFDELFIEGERRMGIAASSDFERFDRQIAFAADSNHFKAALCGRRAGKTRELIYELRDSLNNHPGDSHAYIELTRPSAKRKLWRPFKRLNERYRWGLRFHESDLEVSHPNGAMLAVVGADKEQEIDKVRGLERLRLACIDECGKQKPLLLKYLVEDVIEPGLMDVNGSMLLSGTPGHALTGYWFDVTGQSPPLPGWSRHHWTVYDNPYIDAVRFITELLSRRGWDKDNPTFQREYLGKWIKDLSRLIFAYSKDNLIDALPAAPGEKSWTFVLTLDFGTASATSFVVLGYPPIGRKVYIFESHKEIGLAPTEVADRVRDLITKYHPIKIIGDVHGLGKAYAAEMIKRHNIAIIPANKANKRAVIEYVSDAFRTGQLLNYRENVTLDRELETLLWDEEHKDIADGQDDHETEALVYGYEHCPAYTNAVAPPPEEMDDVPEYVRRSGERRTDDAPYWAVEEEW